MIRVYVAGPYSANNVITVLQNIGRGEAAAAMLFKEGFAPFTPWHDKDFCIKLFNEKLTVKQFYDFSMAWLKVSEVLFLVEGWDTSNGTLDEISLAKELAIPIFTTLEGIKIWRDGYNKKAQAIQYLKSSAESDIGQLVKETAMDIFADCDALEDFCVQSSAGSVIVFGGINRVLWHPRTGFALDEAYCTPKFKSKFAALNTQ